MSPVNPKISIQRRRAVVFTSLGPPITPQGIHPHCLPLFPTAFPSSLPLLGPLPPTLLHRSIWRPRSGQMTFQCSLPSPSPRKASKASPWRDPTLQVRVWKPAVSLGITLIGSSRPRKGRPCSQSRAPAPVGRASGGRAPPRPLSTPQRGHAAHRSEAWPPSASPSPPISLPSPPSSGLGLGCVTPVGGWGLGGRGGEQEVPVWAPDKLGSQPA